MYLKNVVYRLRSLYIFFFIYEASLSRFQLSLAKIHLNSKYFRTELWYYLINETLNECVCFWNVKSNIALFVINHHLADLLKNTTRHSIMNWTLETRFRLELWYPSAYWPSFTFKREDGRFGDRHIWNRVDCTLSDTKIELT